METDLADMVRDAPDSSIACVPLHLCVQRCHCVYASLAAHVFTMARRDFLLFTKMLDSLLQKPL